jgi:hypothetical protein
MLYRLYICKARSQGVFMIMGIIWSRQHNYSNVIMGIIW